jgi:hypothetical protein
VRDPVLVRCDGDAPLSGTGQRPTPPTRVTVQGQPNVLMVLSESRQVTLMLIIQDLERIVIHQAHFSLLASS